jgi:hypothetical protein
MDYPGQETSWYVLLQPDCFLRTSYATVHVMDICYLATLLANKQKTLFLVKWKILTFYISSIVLVCLVYISGNTILT